MSVWIMDLLDQPVGFAYKGAAHRWYILDEWRAEFLATAARKSDIIPSFELFKIVQKLCQ